METTRRNGAGRLEAGSVAIATHELASDEGVVVVGGGGTAPDDGAGSADAAASLRTIAASAFILQLGIAPISAALPSIVADFGGTVQEAGWVFTSFLIVLTGLVLVGGRLGDFLGHQRVFRTGVILFGVASLVAGLSADLPQLIAARAFQGIGGALLSGNGLAILATDFAAARRGRAIGVVGMWSSLGGVIGLLISTFSVTWLSWRWLFLLAAALAIPTILLTWRQADRPRAQAGARLDVLGAALTFAVLTFFTLSLSHLHEGEETFAAGLGYHTSMHALTLAALAALLWWELRAPEPLLPLSRLRYASFTSAVGANGILHMTMMAPSFLLPFMVIRGMGLSAVHAGLVLVVTQATTVVSAYLGGWLYDRTRSRLITPITMGVVTAGLIAYGLFAEWLGYAGIFALSAFLGCFTGAFMTVNSTLVMGTLPAEESGLASGMSETTRQLGHTLAVTVIAAVVGLAGITLGPRATPEEYVTAFRLATLTMSVFALLGIVLSLRANVRSGTGRRREAAEAAVAEIRAA